MEVTEEGMDMAEEGMDMDVREEQPPKA